MFHESIQVVLIKFILLCWFINVIHFWLINVCVHLCHISRMKRLSKFKRHHDQRSFSVAVYIQRDIQINKCLPNIKHKLSSLPTTKTPTHPTRDKNILKVWTFLIWRHYNPYNSWLESLYLNKIISDIMELFINFVLSFSTSVKLI